MTDALIEIVLTLLCVALVWTDAPIGAIVFACTMYLGSVIRHTNKEE